MAKSSQFKKEKCRAYCHSCDFTGNWRTDVEVAKQDARDHLTEFPKHDVDLEFNQSFIVRFREEA